MEAPEPLLAKKRRRAPTTTETPAPVSPAAAAETRRRAPVAVVAAVVVAAFAGIGYLGWGRLRPATLPRDPGLSVLLVSIDTLRADALGGYGKPARARPGSTASPREGVRFDAGARPQRRNAALAREHAVRACCRSSTACATTTGFRVPEGRDDAAPRC